MPSCRPERKSAPKTSFVNRSTPRRLTNDWRVSWPGPSFGWCTAKSGPGIMLDRTNFDILSRPPGPTSCEAAPATRAACSRFARLSRYRRGVPGDERGDRAHQGHSLWHEHLKLGGLSRDGAQPHFTPHGKRRCPLEHWVDVRRDSSGILRAVCRRLVKLTASGRLFPRHRERPHLATTTTGGNDEIRIRTADTATGLRVDLRRTGQPDGGTPA